MTAHHATGRRARAAARREKRKRPTVSEPRVDEVVDGEFYAPPEQVVFLTPWQRFGLRRLYVMDEYGADGGHLDLRTGELAATRSFTEGILRQVLPQLSFGVGRVGIS